MDFYNSSQGSDYIQKILGLNKDSNTSVSNPLLTSSSLQPVPVSILPTPSMPLVSTLLSNSQPTCFDRIPKTMKRLVRLAVSAFHGLEQGVVIDQLIHYPCLREDHLSQLVRFERKALRTALAPLKADRFIKSQMRLVTDRDSTTDPIIAPISETLPHPNFKNQQFTYFYIDYHAALNAVRYKLDAVAEALEQEERAASIRSTFACGTCEACYTDLDVDQLFDSESGELFCPACDSILRMLGDEPILETNQMAKGSAPSLTKREARKMITLFNTQLEPLFSLLRKAENVVLAPHLIKPEPVDIDIDNLANAVSSYSSASDLGGNIDMASNNQQRIWKNSAKKYVGAEYEWYKTGGITINIQTETDPDLNDDIASYCNSSNEPNSTRTRSDVEKIGHNRSKIPVWLASDTSNVMGQYRKRLLSTEDEQNDKNLLVKSFKKIAHLESSTVDLDKNNEVDMERGITETLLIYESKSFASQQPDNNILPTSADQGDQLGAINSTNDHQHYNEGLNDDSYKIDIHSNSPDLIISNTSREMFKGGGDSLSHATFLNSSLMSPDTMMVGDVQVILSEIGSDWLMKMTAHEKEIYYKLSKLKFDLLYDY